jgi:hypothetical protein
MITLAIYAKTVLASETEEIFLRVFHEADITKLASFRNWVSPPVHKVLVKVFKQRTFFFFF